MRYYNSIQRETIISCYCFRTASLRVGPQRGGFFYSVALSELSTDNIEQVKIVECAVSAFIVGVDHLIFHQQIEIAVDTGCWNAG